MKHKTMLFRVLFLVALIATIASSAVAQGTDSQVRFVHAIPDASPVDIFVNGQLAISNLAFSEASNYITAPAGEHQIAVTPTGIATPLWEQTVTTGAGSVQTLVASSPAALSFTAYEDNLEATGFGNARLLLVHAIAEAPAVDVVLNSDGTVIASDMGYGAAFGTFDVPANVYDVAITPTGSDVTAALLPSVPLSLNSGTYNIAIVYGTAAAPQAALVTSPANAGPDTGLVRFAHTIAGAPAVDIFVNDTMIAPSLAAAQATPHIALPAGSHNVTINEAGTTSALLTASITVEAGAAQTVAALGTPESAAAGVFVDDTTGVNASSAAISIINAIPDAQLVSASFTDGTVLAQNVPFGQSSPAATAAPTNQALSVEVMLGGQSGVIDVPQQNFYGGVYYNVFVMPGDVFSGPTVVTAATNLSQSIASAPGSADAVLAAPDAAAPDQSAGDVFATTPEPAQPAAPQPSSDGTVVARVALNPGANLQLRQYPSSTAFSLGLAPSGSTLLVNGREGAPVFAEGEPIPAELLDESGELIEWEDPADELDPTDRNADLDPETTWLNVTYNTPDGGSITAWVNVLYLDVTFPENDRDLEKLAQLPMIPNNLAGLASNTAITPPVEPEDSVTVVVINLDAGTNLNMRRTAETSGEVLVRVPNGTVLEFLGMTQEGDWYFANFVTAEGGLVSGWLNSSFGRLELNGALVDLETLDAEGLLVYVEGDTRGEIGGSVSPVSMPTPEPLKDVVVAEVVLDPGSNLQLRRDPSSEAESLDLVPAGTRLVVDGLTADKAWLSVEFEGTTGWIASTFVALTFNGRFVEIDQVEFDEAGTVIVDGAPATNIAPPVEAEADEADAPEGSSSLPSEGNWQVNLPARVTTSCENTAPVDKPLAEVVAVPANVFMLSDASATGFMMGGGSFGSAGMNASGQPMFSGFIELSDRMNMQLVVRLVSNVRMDGEVIINFIDNQNGQCSANGAVSVDYTG